jgi:hypothetical protein
MPSRFERMNVDQGIVAQDGAVVGEMNPIPPMSAANA